MWTERFRDHDDAVRDAVIEQRSIIATSGSHGRVIQILSWQDGLEERQCCHRQQAVSGKVSDPADPSIIKGIYVILTTLKVLWLRVRRVP